MNWLYYLLEANLYLILFYGFYRLFLHKETFYRLNRYFLIFSSVLAFLLPFFQIGFLRTLVTGQIGAVPAKSVTETALIDASLFETYQSGIFTFDHILITTYALITLSFLFKLFFGLFKIVRMLKLPCVQLEKGVKLFDLKDSKVAFSFFNLLFMDPQLSERNTILKHELVHIRQKHSLDVLLFEMIQIMNWFNPFSYLIKRDIKLIHEYLADEETISQGIERYDYAMFLIKNSTGIKNLTLTNQIFSSSILKRRISMLNQKKSAAWAKLKLLLALPITGGILCLSTMAFTKDYGLVDLYPKDLKSSHQDSSKIKYTTMQDLEKKSVLFTTAVSVNGKTKKQTSFEKRLILINGEQIKDNNDFFAAANFDKKIELNANDAVKKYGNKAKYGAVELVGPKVKVLKQMPPPPPMEPKVKAKQPLTKIAPPPPPSMEPKVNAKQPLMKIAPPPPPMEPASKVKKTITKIAPPPPPKEPV
ncbi:M56 family metallopeptidase [Pedobacter punctiformis]|uniref:M56 family metallopeptidase n=1 Tax=Pedobacter punctiformis TaxID=3004097 RepID=A0ABT4LAP6_9SPHI|nr:M56 family metallopeptidase [Pedobacter sp. HCMS5-2]MCZ4245002.1 M56 family metallopeptidase [Pedobacter sp. HCMS5-2]